MPPGTEQAIQSAVSTGRYEAVVLVVIMLTVAGFLVYVVKAVMAQALARETRLSSRLDVLEDFIRSEMMAAMGENTKAMLTISVQAGETTKALVDLIEALHTTRICFATGEQQGKLVDTIASRVVREIQSLNARQEK